MKKKKKKLIMETSGVRLHTGFLNYKYIYLDPQKHGMCRPRGDQM